MTDSHQLAIPRELEDEGHWRDIYEYYHLSDTLEFVDGNINIHEWIRSTNHSLGISSHEMNTEYYSGSWTCFISSNLICLYDENDSYPDYPCLIFSNTSENLNAIKKAMLLKMT